MKNFLQDFKIFALSGNVVDLAIGVILGIAFNAVVETFANNVLLGLIGAVFQIPDPSHLSVNVNGTEIRYGTFVAALLQFVIIAVTLLLLVKLLIRVGMNFRAQGNRECLYCKSFIPVDATKCMYCTSKIVPIVPD